MHFKFYQDPDGTGWLGWVESCQGDVIGFVDKQGKIVTEW